MVTHDIKACSRGNQLLFLADEKGKGDFELGEYTPETKAFREEAIFQYLKENEW